MKPSYGCPRCTKELVEVSPRRYRCTQCDITLELQHAVWRVVERGVS